MHENCNPNNCPVGAKVDSLEKEFENYRHSSKETHKEMFSRIGALEQNNAAIKERLSGIWKTMDTLSSDVGSAKKEIAAALREISSLSRTEKDLEDLGEDVEEIKKKPGERWEMLVGCVLSALAGAFLLWVVSGMPGLK